MFTVLLFVVGLAFGSFVNVLAVRYQPDRQIFTKDILTGRSHCPHCKKTLKWYELIPLFSFFVQMGKCRNCNARLSFQYPLIELLSGFIFISVPYYFTNYFFPLHVSPDISFYALNVIWILTFLTLILLSLIDLRLRIIPNEVNLFLVALGVLQVFLGGKYFGSTAGSFTGSYALLFGFRDTIWQNHLVAAFIPAIFLLILIILTKGKGMGIGDVKLIFGLGLIFGWPDILIILFFAFLLGSLYGIAAILAKRKTMKTAVPFGPFIALGALLVFWVSFDLLNLYFRIFNL